jgi:hypothetical protein
MTRRPSIPFVVLAAVLGAGILFALAWSPPVITPAPPAERRPAASAGGASTVPEAAAPERLRNVFAYDEPAPQPMAPEVLPIPQVSVPPPLALPPPSPVALVGFVRQGGTVRAAVSIRGEVTVLATGESAGGYVVLAIDEDRGVTLRDPDGTEITLAPPS